MPEVRKERQNVGVKCMTQMKDGEGKVGMCEGSGGKRGRWSGEGADGKVQASKQRIGGRSFTPQHSGSHQQNGAGGGVGGDNTQVENNSPWFPGGLVSAISPINCPNVSALWSNLMNFLIKIARGQS